MTKPNKLVEASFYKKEGAMLWIMYFLFFIVGYYYGKKFDYIWDVCIFFVIMLVVVIILGKENQPKER